VLAYSSGADMMRVRNVRLPFGAAPRYWFAGHRAATHLSNALNLLFPVGERFFIRSVRHYLDRVEDDPELMGQIRCFFGQEGNHAREHQRFASFLDSLGYEVQPFLDEYERVQSGIERLLPPILRLSATAACEHFTASLADNALRSPVFQEMHPEVKSLLLWHAAEEIEHKAVAYDVLQRVDSRYTVRVAGLVIATTLLLAWWLRAFRMLVEQDGMTLREALAELRSTELDGRHRTPQDVMRYAFKDYLDLSFHPWNHDNSALARDYIATMVLAESA